MPAPEPLLRDRSAPGHERVGYIELFYDLLYAFAITQLSHKLIEHPSVESALETLFLLLAVWVVWMWTTWATSWLNTRAAPVQLLLFFLTGVGLVMSVSIPEAFGARGLYFATAYAIANNVRTLFTVRALKRGRANERLNFIRIETWLAASAVFWIAGAFFTGGMRWALWIIGLAIDLSGPWLEFWVPGLGRSTTADWRGVEPAHMAERCGLFVILALGESIIELGATFSDHVWTWASKTAFIMGFIGTAATWWVYFAATAEAADEIFRRQNDPGRIARAAYTYAHIPLIAGIILAAVGEERVLAQPLGLSDPTTVLALLGGAALFLSGSALFTRMIFGVFPPSHLVGLALLLGGFFVAPHMSPLRLLTAGSGVVVLVGAWESLASSRRIENALEEAE
jgi:low temperature requirement protein LtrA